MALALNKTSLKQQRDHLAMYQQFLPSLDLKRQQLIAYHQQARRILSTTRQAITNLRDSHNGLFALLGASAQDLSGLVTTESVTVRDENLLGVRLPVLEDVNFRVAEYSMLAKPFWVDFLVELLQEIGRVTIRLGIEEERERRLEVAVRRITQRVNLFEKVLIPKAEESIKRIRIYLADSERAAVVRSKIAKTKQGRHAAAREVW